MTSSDLRGSLWPDYDPGDLILAPGEPGDLRWRVSYRKYHVSQVIHSIVWSQVMLVTSLSH